MQEIGVDISKHKPKHITKAKRKFDIVVNMSSDIDLKRYRNSFKNAEFIRWEVRDPRGESILHYRVARDFIREKLRSLL